MDEVCPLCEGDRAWCCQKIPPSPTATMHLLVGSMVGEDLQGLEFCRAIETTAMDGLKELWDRGVQRDPFCEYRERAYDTLKVRVDTGSFGDLSIFVSRTEHKAFKQGSTNRLVQDGIIPQERRFAEVPWEFESSAGIQDIMKQSVSAVANFEQRKGR